MMGANYRQGHQGKRKDQVEFSQKMVAFSVVTSIVLIIIWGIWSLLSNF